MTENAKSADASGVTAADASGAAKAKASEAAKVPPTRSTGPESATGAALAAQAKEVPSGDERGSKVKTGEGDAQPDAKVQAPVGAQAEPARFTSNGQVPHATVGSPTGSVPVSALASSPEDAEKRIDEQNEAHDDFVAKRLNRDRRLDPATLNRLSGAELRAIGAQRGYKLPDYSGSRTTRQAFIEAQDKDTNLPK